VVSTNYLKSIGHPAASAPVKNKSVHRIACGSPVSISKTETASNGKLGAAKPGTEKTYQNRAVNPGSGAKGHGGSISKAATIRDPLQKGGRK
jgi:hypothetical protein